MYRTIKVKSCGGCPFSRIDGEYGDRCDISKKVNDSLLWFGSYKNLPRDKVHEFCPLKEKELRVKLNS